MFTVGMGSWWAVFAVGRGSWWAVFIIRRGSVGADSGPLLSFVGTGSWGGAGPCSLLVGWCWYWAVVVVGGVVMGHCQRSWGGDGPSSWWVVVGPRSRRVVLGRNRTMNDDHLPPGCHVTDMAPGSGVSKQ